MPNVRGSQHQRGFDLAGAAEQILRAAFEGLKDGAEIVFEDSQAKVPVLDPADESKGRISGDLKATGGVTPLEASNQVAIHYGTPYAAYIHEHMHFKHPNGGQAKFLESALIEKRDDVAHAVAERIREVTK